MQNKKLVVENAFQVQFTQLEQGLRLGWNRYLLDQVQGIGLSRSRKMVGIGEVQGFYWAKLCIGLG